MYNRNARCWCQERRHVSARNTWGGGHDFTQTLRGVVPCIVPPLCDPAVLEYFFFFAKITVKMTSIWMAMSHYLTLACFEMRAAARISVFMSSGVRLRTHGASTSTTSYVFMA